MENPFDILHSQYAELYVLGKCLIYLGYLGKGRGEVVIKRLEALIRLRH